MTLIAARAAVMARMVRCPVCGADAREAEKSDNLETIAFACEAAFYLQRGGIIAASRICAAPTHLAVRHLEQQAAHLAAKEES